MTGDFWLCGWQRPTTTLRRTTEVRSRLTSPRSVFQTLPREVVGQTKRVEMIYTTPGQYSVPAGRHGRPQTLYSRLNSAHHHKQGQISLQTEWEIIQNHLRTSTSILWMYDRFLRCGCIERKKRKLMAYAVKRVAGAHLPNHWLFEPVKRPDDRAEYCLDCKDVENWMDW